MVGSMNIESSALWVSVKELLSSTSIGFPGVDFSFEITEGRLLFNEIFGLISSLLRLTFFFGLGDDGFFWASSDLAYF